MNEKANYVTCPKGHKIFVVWSEQLRKFGFTCDECEEHSLRAVSMHGTIEIRLLPPRNS
jgi:hypothetical protein